MIHVTGFCAFLYLSILRSNTACQALAKELTAAKAPRSLRAPQALCALGPRFARDMSQENLPEQDAKNRAQMRVRQLQLQAQKSKTGRASMKEARAGDF